MQTAARSLAFTLCSLASIACGAQTGDARPEIHSSLQVPMYASVRAADGKILKGLQASDFVVLQDKKPVTVTAVRELTAATKPVNVLIVMDAVNEDAITFARARTEVDHFLRANGGHLAYPTKLVIATDAGASSQANFTTDGNAAAAALARVPNARRTYNESAGGFGAVARISSSLNLLQQLAAKQANAKVHTVILWMSLGWPMLAKMDMNIPRHQEEQLFSSVVEFSNLLREANVTLNSIDPMGSDRGAMQANLYEGFLGGIRDWSDVAYANLGLQVLAVHSGGRAIHSTNDIPGAMALCLSDAADQYELTFVSAPTQKRDEYHSLSVQVNRAGAGARSQPGYYAEPPNRMRLTDARP